MKAPVWASSFNNQPRTRGSTGLGGLRGNTDGRSGLGGNVDNGARCGVTTSGQITFAPVGGFGSWSIARDARPVRSPAVVILQYKSKYSDSGTGRRRRRVPSGGAWSANGPLKMQFFLSFWQKVQAPLPPGRTQRI